MGPRARLDDSDNLQDVMGETLASCVRRLPRASDLSGSGLSDALPIGVLGHGSGALPGGVQAQPATSPSSVPATAAPSASAAGSSQAVPLVSTPAGLALGVAVYRVRDRVVGKRRAKIARRDTPLSMQPSTAHQSRACTAFNCVA
jgi:hypothetical protein